VALAALDAGTALNDEPALAALAAALPPPAPADAARLRGEGVGQAASQVSALPRVRAALLEAQRDFARRPPAPFKGGCCAGSGNSGSPPM
jgi:cytidylate kinase